jgi:hypothetical protein
VRAAEEDVERLEQRAIERQRRKSKVSKQPTFNETPTFDTPETTTP